MVMMTTLANINQTYTVSKHILSDRSCYPHSPGGKLRTREVLPLCALVSSTGKWG